MRKSTSLPFNINQRNQVHVELDVAASAMRGGIAVCNTQLHSLSEQDLHSYIKTVMTDQQQPMESRRYSDFVTGASQKEQQKVMASGVLKRSSTMTIEQHHDTYNYSSVPEVERETQSLKGMVRNMYEERRASQELDPTSLPSVPSFTSSRSASFSSASTASDVQPIGSPRQHKKRKTDHSAPFITEGEVAISAFKLLISLFWLFVGLFTYCWAKIRAIS